MPRKPSIALIGMRGAGKTVVGRELSRLCGIPHVDTDDLVVQAAGRSIATIFETQGEAAFRALEADAVKAAVSRCPAIISVGGGALMDPKNVEALQEVATIVWLTAPIEVLWQRMQRDPQTAQSRPPLSPLDGLDELQQILAKRMAIYRTAADMEIEAVEQSPADLARIIQQRVPYNRAGPSNSHVCAD